MRISGETYWETISIDSAEGRKRRRRRVRMCKKADGKIVRATMVKVVYSKSCSKKTHTSTAIPSNVRTSRMDTGSYGVYGDET